MAPYLLVLSVVVGICNAQNWVNPGYPQNTGYPANPNPPYNPNYQQREPVISSDRSFGFTTEMERDAVEFLKTAYRTGNGNECVVLRDLFTTKYPDSIWHVAKAKAYAVRYIKSIDLLAGMERFILFSTKK